jgi:hypothetical protein
MPAAGAGGGIHKVRVTDLEYKNDIKRTVPVIARGKTRGGFMCCFGPGGHIFGHYDRKDMWYCKAWDMWWLWVLKNTADVLAQLDITFSHGVYDGPDKKEPADPTLCVYTKSPQVRTLYRSRRSLLNFTRARRVTHLLVRLQRWFLRLLSLWRSKRLAVAMSMHARLGSEAGLGALGEDIILGLILATRTTAGSS